ncbi:MAG: hypothetical protein RLZZ450_172 [Pseudomonadota bacterium]|jgi:hypothetical protein
MRVLVIFGGLTFFARCWDQAQPYLRVINKKGASPSGEPATPPAR